MIGYLLDSQTTLYWASLGLLAASALLFWLPRTHVAGSCAAALGLGALTLTLAARTIAAGRPPVLGTFENSLVAAWMLAVVALVLCTIGPFARRAHLARLVMPWAVLVLGYGSGFEREPMRIEAASRSIVGYSHALAGWLAFAVLTAASMAALGLLLSRREGEASAWDESLSRLTGAGFALLTATMSSGAVYSFMLFSEWYRWQVVEAFSAAAWLSYGLVLHSRLMFGWRGRRLAWSVLAVVPLMLAAFWIWSVYPDTYHYFEGVLAVR
jgi:ABC-type uncharacterized transport system permease subunit